jgi:uncharacterized membrane protein
MWKNFIDRVQTVAIGTISYYNQILYSVIAWGILVLGLYIFVLDKIKSVQDCIIWGALYAFVIYGVFNFTNLAIMQNVYTVQMASRDIFSGTITTVLSLLAFYFITKSL